MDFERLEEEVQNILISISTEQGHRLFTTDLCNDVSEEIIKIIKKYTIE